MPSMSQAIGNVAQAVSPALPISTPNGQTMNGTLKGKIEGNNISGQMGMMGRNSDFTGSKTPKE